MHDCLHSFFEEASAMEDGGDMCAIMVRIL
jgi:hypothetical protein